MADHNQSIQSWCTEIDSITRVVVETFSHFPEEFLNHPGKDGSWSIAENLKHLIIVNSTYFPLLDKLLTQKSERKTHRFRKWIAQKIGSWVLKSVSRSRQSKMKTFSKWEPEHFHEEGKIISHFSLHQDVLKKYIQSSQQLLESDCVIPSPANHLVFYRLEDAFRIIIEHEWRHLRQAMESTTP